MPRKIIQIACSESRTEGTESFSIVALCDDGTAWDYVPARRRFDPSQNTWRETAPARWKKMLPIPQPEDEPIAVARHLEALAKEEAP